MTKRVIDEHLLGTKGLQLAVDSTQLAAGSLTFADGVRFQEAGAVISREGRERLEQEVPDESATTGTSDTGAYYTIDHLRTTATGGIIRGYSPLWSQTIYWDSGQANTDTLRNMPEHLRHLYKIALSPTPLLEIDQGKGRISGRPYFTNPDTIAQFVTVGKKTYIADPDDPPLVVEPLAGLTHNFRVEWVCREMGIKYPRANTDICTIGVGNPSASYPDPGVLSGTFYVRATIENGYGIESNPTLPAIQRYDTPASKLRVTFPTIPTDLQIGPNAGVKWKVYIAFQQAVTQDYVPEESAFYFIKEADILDVWVEIDGDELEEGLGKSYLLNLDHGHPPRLTAFTVVNNIGIGVSGVDKVYRETIPTTGQGQIAGYRWVRQGGTFVKDYYYTGSEITEVEVDGSYVFWSNPGEPEYMENYARVGFEGNERLVGVGVIGKAVFLFSDGGIYVLDPFEPSIKPVYSKVGCGAKDSIVSTEQGIIFMGTDGVLRLFNGANVESIMNDIAPIFNRSDYDGDYNIFDRERAHETICVWHESILYMLYPIQTEGVYGKMGAELDNYAPQKNLAVGDFRWGAPRWAIDEKSYDMIFPVTRTSQIIGVDSDGWFWDLNRGFIDEGVTISGNQSPKYSVKFKKYAGANLQYAIFHQVGIDLDTQGQPVTVRIELDDGREAQNYSAITNGRELKKFWLPSRFRGRYITIQVTGYPATRISTYGVTVETSNLGEM